MNRKTNGLRSTPFRILEGVLAIIGLVFVLEILAIVILRIWLFHTLF